MGPPCATAAEETTKAANNIVINADITRSGPGGVTLKAGSGSVSGTGNLVLGGGTQLLLNQGTTLSNNIQLTSGGATLGFAPFEVDFLIVGAGGGGGADGGSGGGGGGLRETLGHPVLFALDHNDFDHLVSGLFEDQHL